MSIINLLIISECNNNPLLKSSNGKYISLNGEYYIALTCSLNIHAFAKYITPRIVIFPQFLASYIIRCWCNFAKLFICPVWFEFYLFGVVS